MRHFDFEKAVKRYNSIMESLCYEHVTIGTRLSEGTENWNIRDMVAECDYVLSTYFEDGHANEELRHGDEEERKVWRSETGRLQRFIAAYEPFIEGVYCHEGHCSSYDNQKEGLKVVQELLADVEQRSGEITEDERRILEDFVTAY